MIYLRHWRQKLTKRQIQLLCCQKLWLCYLSRQVTEPFQSDVLFMEWEDFPAERIVNQCSRLYSVRGCHWKWVKTQDGDLKQNVGVLQVHSRALQAPGRALAAAVARLKVGFRLFHSASYVFSMDKFGRFKSIKPKLENLNIWFPKVSSFVLWAKVRHIQKIERNCCPESMA